MSKTELSQQEIHSPFQNANAVMSKAATADKDQVKTIEKVSYQSPFQSKFAEEVDNPFASPESEEFVQLLDELHDEEFSEHLQELAIEAQEIHTKAIGQAMQDNEHYARQAVQEHYQPILREFDSYMGYLEEQGHRLDRQEITEEEFETATQVYLPQRNLSPRFEQFFKRLGKKIFGGIKKVAKAGVRLAKKGVSALKKLGLGPALAALRRIAGKFLKSFIARAIKQLPPNLQPIARKLAKKLGAKVSRVADDIMGAKATGRSAASRAMARRIDGRFGRRRRRRFRKEFDRSYDASAFQLELDGAMAEVLLADSEAAQQQIASTYGDSEFSNEASNSSEMLERARERFVEEIANLAENESPEPAVENFVSAILTAIKVGIRIIGKEKVMKFLSKHLAKLISKLVGRQYGPLLSRIIVQKGFALLNLELSQEAQTRIAASTIGSVIEDTVREVSSLSDEVLEDRELLEGYVINAFEKAAASNLPDLLPESEYIKRPDLREAMNHQVSWYSKPRSKAQPWKRHKYKKLSKVFHAELNPYLLNAIKTSRGISLANAISSYRGLIVRHRIPVRVHLYETLQSGNRKHIARSEQLIRRMAGNGIARWKLLHPLTSTAAGLLLGEPKLGCACGQCLEKSLPTDGGHRYYFLEIPETALSIHEAPTGMQRLRAASLLSLKLDLTRKNIHLKLQINEEGAQKLATHLRQKNYGAAHKQLIAIATAGLRSSLSERNLNVRIVHPGLMPGKNSAKALRNVPPVLLNELQESITESLEKFFAGYLKEHYERLIEAANSKADGIEMQIKLHSPDLAILNQHLSKDYEQVEMNVAQVELSIKNQ